MLIPKSVLAIEKLAAKFDGRFPMSGVRFSRSTDGKPEAAVTDGYLLLIATWREPSREDCPTSLDPGSPKPGFSVIIPADAVQEAGKSVPAKSPKPILRNLALREETTNGTVEMISTDLARTRTLSARVLDGSFPCLQSVLPKLKPKATATLSTYLLRELLKTMEEAAPDTTDDAFILEFHGPEAPVVLRRENGEVQLLAALMPITDRAEPKQDKPKERAVGRPSQDSVDAC